MEIQISQHTTSNYFILGAGASVDYNLPTWTGLTELTQEFIYLDNDDEYTYKSEMREWLAMVGEGRKYETIDRCIEKESRIYPDGLEIEKELFDIFRRVLDLSFKSNSKGWIELLNSAVLKPGSNLQQSTLLFINFNYDSILVSRFLNYADLNKKDANYYRREIENFQSSQNLGIYPNGKLFEVTSKNLNVRSETRESPHGDFDAMSCYDIDTKTFISRRFPEYLESGIKLYILGLGLGLEYNLDNLILEGEVQEIHITVRESVDDTRIKKYLFDKYEIKEECIYIHRSCASLIKDVCNVDESMFRNK